jgi:hypothetical protein
VLAQQTNKNQLDEKTLNRLSELMEEVSGDYIKLQDGEQVVLSFDLNSQATGARTRPLE